MSTSNHWPFLDLGDARPRFPGGKFRLLLLLRVALDLPNFSRRLPRAANGTEDEDGEKDKFDRDARGARKSSREIGKIESDSEKEEKAKFASRKSGTRIAEVEKRPVVARLKADEAEWKKRDVHTRHETATLEIGKAVAWHYAPTGKPGELWFRFGVIVDIIGGKLKEDKAGKNSNPDVNVTLRAVDPSRAVQHKFMAPSTDVESA